MDAPAKKKDYSNFYAVVCNHIYRIIPPWIHLLPISAACITDNPIEQKIGSFNVKSKSFCGLNCLHSKSYLLYNSPCNAKKLLGKQSAVDWI